LQENFIEKIKAYQPELYREKIARYIHDLKLPLYDAEVISEEKEFALYFEKLISYTSSYKAAANWMLGPVKNWLNENKKEIGEFPLLPSCIAKLVEMVGDGKLSFSIASSKIFPQLMANPSADPGKLASEQNLMQQSDVSAIAPLIEMVLKKFEDKVDQYKKGKKGLLALFVGEVIKQSKGKADPKLVNQLLLEKLKS